MKKLPLTFKRGEYVYYQVSRQDNVALYEISNHEGKAIRYELIRVKLTPRFIAGNIEHEEVLSKALHTFPGEMGEDKALQAFFKITGVEPLLKKEKKPRKNQASYDARRDNGNRKIFEI